MSIQIQAFDYKNASSEAFAAFNDCRNQVRREKLPDDPSIPVEETILMLKNLPEFLEIHIWLARKTEDQSVVAFGLTNFSNEDNLNMAQFSMEVLPEYRRQGLGKRLLARIVQNSQENDRSLLLAGTMNRIPGGKAFMERIGAKLGLEGHTNQLTIADLDKALLTNWVETGKKRAADYEIGVWEGKYPEEYLDDIVELYGLLNQQPFGELEIEDFNYSAERVRQIETSMFSRGYQRWTFFAKEKSTQDFAGYTEIFWNPNRPDVLLQEMTGVFPQHRNNGLGRWLKAETLMHVLKVRPQAKFVRTENADSNAPMLKINNELGFKPYIAEGHWQVETEKAAAYLAGS